MNCENVHCIVSCSFTRPNSNSILHSIESVSNKFSSENSTIPVAFLQLLQRKRFLIDVFHRKTKMPMRSYKMFQLLMQRLWRKNASLNWKILELESKRDVTRREEFHWSNTFHCIDVVFRCIWSSLSDLCVRYGGERKIVIEIVECVKKKFNSKNRYG